MKQCQCNMQPTQWTPVAHLSLLRTIRRQCWKITDAAIVAVANNCANLASLDIEYVV